MEQINQFSSGVIDVLRKYVWVSPLEDKKSDNADQIRKQRWYR